MIVTVIFTILLICVIWGLIQKPLEALLSYAIELLISALIGGFVGWLISLLIGFSGLWWICALVGVGYTIFCWIFSKDNVILGWWFTND